MALNDLTLDDIAEVERLSGQSLADLGNPDAKKGVLMKAIVFVSKRQQDPSFTFEQAGKLTMAEMNEVLGEDPTSLS